MKHLRFGSLAMSGILVACGGGSTESAGASSPSRAASQSAPESPSGPAPAQLDQPTIQRVVRAAFPQLTECHRSGLKRDPNAGSSVIIRFTILSDGTVTDARDAHGMNPAHDAQYAEWERDRGKPPVRDPQVLRCVLDEFGKMQFPRSQKERAEVTYPLVLNP